LYFVLCLPFLKFLSDSLTTILEWTKTCCYVGLKLNICIRWQVCVFIYTDHVFAKFHGNWSNVLHIKMDIPMFYACAKQYTSHKIIFILFWICKHLLSEQREIMHHFETSEGFVTHVGWHQPFSQITPGNYKCNCPFLSYILPSHWDTSQLTDQYSEMQWQQLESS